MDLCCWALIPALIKLLIDLTFWPLTVAIMKLHRSGRGGVPFISPSPIQIPAPLWDATTKAAMVV